MWIKHWAVCSSKRKMLKRPDVCFKKLCGLFFFVGCSLRKEIAEDYRAGCSPHNPVPPTFLIAHKIGILYIWAVLPFTRKFASFVFACLTAQLILCLKYIIWILVFKKWKPEFSTMFSFLHSFWEDFGVMASVRAHPPHRRHLFCRKLGVSTQFTFPPPPDVAYWARMLYYWTDQALAGL